MDCEKVRDLFSSLWEKELTPSEEKIVREHLTSCPECQKELERFEKMMRWLHSIGEVEVPDGFLPELYKKMEERKGKAILAEKAKGRWLSFPDSLKLPVQAVAMVAIVFLVLYLTKMMPMEGYRLKDGRQPPSPFLAEKRSEQVLAQKEIEKEKRAMEIPPETLQPKDVEQAKTFVPGKEKREKTLLGQGKGGEEREEAPPQKSEITAYRIESKGVEKERIQSPQPEKIGKGWAVQEKPVETSKTPQEIVLRISDRDRAMSQLYELIKQMGGEIVTAEGDMLLASLPAESFSAFEKGLRGVRDSIQADKGVAKKHATGSLKVAPGVKREKVDEKSKTSTTHAMDEKEHIVVRIFLIQE